MLRCAFLLLAFFGALAPQSPSTAQKFSLDANKYYKLRALSVGPIVLTNMTMLATPEYRIGKDREHVPHCSILHAHVVFHNPSSSEVGGEFLSGDLVEGTGQTSSSNLVGDFTWSGDHVSNVAISQLSLTLKNVRIHGKFVGASLTLPSSSQTIIENVTPISAGEEKGTGALRFTIFNPMLNGIMLEWQGIPMSVDASTPPHTPFVLTIDLETGNLTPINAVMNARGTAKGEISKPLDSFFPDERIDAGKVQVSGLSLHWTDGSLKVAAKNINIAEPHISLLPYASLEVKGALELVANSITASGDTSAQVISVQSPDGIGGFWIEPDVYAVVDQLNFSGKFNQPEAIVPTGDKTIRFSKVSALSKFYTNLAEAGANRSSTQINRVVLRTDGKILTDSQRDAVPFEQSKGSPYPKYKGAQDKPQPFDNPIAVLVGMVTSEYTGGLASDFVGKLLGMTVPRQVIGRLMMTSWLNVSRAVNPKLGTAVAYRVVTVSQYLVKKGAEKLVGDPTDDLVEGFSEMLIDQGLPPEAYRILGTDPPKYVLQPKLLAPLQNSPEVYYGDDFATRYRTYLTGIAPHTPTTKEIELLKEFTLASKNRGDVVMSVDAEQAVYQRLGQAVANQEQRNTLTVQQQNSNEQWALGQQNGATSQAETAGDPPPQVPDPRQYNRPASPAPTSPTPSPGTPPTNPGGYIQPLPPKDNPQDKPPNR
jgi:hypothetical protein